MLFPEVGADLAEWIQRESGPWKAQPVKRVYIPKAGNRAKLRPLGIPVLVDRVLQARVVNALEPEWEARFEPKSYGFRPGRGCQDAISAIFLTLSGKNPHRQWALDADLASAFDRIDHDHLLSSLGLFPGRGLVRQWLKAGVVEGGRLAPTEEGTPQGGNVSPLLMNVALHGMEEAAGVRYRKIGTQATVVAKDAPIVIRYADDLIALCHSRDQAEQVKAQLAAWLTPRGLAFNEDKTRIVQVEDEGFDFLGGSVALCEAGAGRDRSGWSDRQGQLSEGSQDPEVCSFLGPEFVVAAADVLDEGVPGADHPCAAESFQAAHWPQSGLQSAVVGFDGVIRVLVQDMAGGGQQLIQCPWVSLCPVGGHLGRSRAVLQRAGEEPAGGRQIPFL